FRRQPIPHVRAEDRHGAVVHLHRVLGVEVERPVDALRRVPLLLLALVVEGEELVAPVLVLPREDGVDLPADRPTGLLDGDLVAELAGHAGSPFAMPFDVTRAAAARSSDSAASRAAA